MPEGFDAGSIFVTLRAQLDDFNSGITQAKSTLDGLTQGAQETTVAFQELDTSIVVFQEIEQSLPRVAQAMSTLGAETNRTTQAVKASSQATDENDKTNQRANITWARSANRIISVQIALLTLAQHGNGPVKEAFQSIANGVSVAAASMQLFQGKVSLLGGGLIGIGVAAVSFFTRYLEENIKATDAATDAQEKMIERTQALTLATQDANLAISVFGGTEADKLVAKLRLEESAFASNLKRIREIGLEISKLNSQTAIYDPDNAAKISALQQERLNLNRQNDTIRSTGAFDKENADVAKLLQSTKDLNKELENTQLKGDIALRLGFGDATEIANSNLTKAKEVLDKMIEDDLKIQDDANKYNITLEQRAALLAKLHSSAQYDTAIKVFKDAKAQDEAVKAVNDLAKTFSTSVGDGLRDAILNAQKPMDALAKVGQNLFANMVDQTVKRLETGLTDAFKAITGAAGEGIGLALTGILGAAGAVLSKLGSKGTDSFSSVQSAVTSTQAVRGIVAGPSSVAIASVSDDLSRAVAPVVAQLVGIAGILGRIEGNTRSGRAGGLSSNVAVGTV